MTLDPTTLREAAPDWQTQLDEALNDCARIIHARVLEEMRRDRASEDKARNALTAFLLIRSEFDKRRRTDGAT
jgi:hypothetical protein